MAYLYLCALGALITGFGGVLFTLVPGMPVRLAYWHFRYRHRVAWIFFDIGLIFAFALGFAVDTLVPLALAGLGVALTYKLHQSYMFPAQDFPDAARAGDLPLSDDMDIALIELNGDARAYALDHVIHHHVVNDRIGGHVVSVTYCAMCRSVIPFDVSEYGPLMVGSFHQSNMILADRETGTFFQQASFQSLIGPLHPAELEMVPFQVLTWGALKQTGQVPLFARFDESDLRPFTLPLPIPGLWARIMASEVTPGLAAGRRDTRLPARTRVIGLLGDRPPLCWRRDAVLADGLIEVAEEGLTLVAAGKGVTAFAETGLTRDGDRLAKGPRRWDLRGQALDDGPALPPVPVSDEYWFSWALWHPGARLRN